MCDVSDVQNKITNHVIIKQSVFKCKGKPASSMCNPEYVKYKISSTRAISNE